MLMIDLCLLGTGGMLPLPNRALTSLMLRCNGHGILIDCGEGTQNQIRLLGWSFKDIDLICFTHYHADHISGLPGLLLTIGNAERTEPLRMMGPKGLIRVVNALRVIAPGLPFEIEFTEFEKEEESFPFFDLHVDAYRVNHSMLCYGYSVRLGRAGRFQADRARALGLPVQLWGRLQHGETVEFSGNTYTPDMVMGEARKGLKVTYCTDTRPCEVIKKYAADADLFICEGMYGEEDKLDKVKEHKHMLMQEACRLAAMSDPQPKQLWLTQYSPATVKPMQYQDRLREIFPEARICRDRTELTLKFEEEETA